jgi:hypothetical protein
MSPHQRPGIAPANWCILSDAPRSPYSSWEAGPGKLQITLFWGDDLIMLQLAI